MWTDENRGRYDRSKLRYPSDLTDEEWSIIGPLIPPAKRGGNVPQGVLQEATQKRNPPIKTKGARFDTLVARYYPAVYSVASRLTDDPREAIALTRDAFNSTRRQLQNLRDEAALASILISAVIRAALTAA